MIMNNTVLQMDETLRGFHCSPVCFALRCSMWAGLQSNTAKLASRGKNEDRSTRDIAFFRPGIRGQAAAEPTRDSRKT